MNAPKLDLPSTKTFTHRSVTLVKLPNAPCDFVIMSQLNEKTSELDISTYAITETRCSFPGGRSFGLRKLSAAIGSDEEQYTTSILPRNSQCNCKSGLCRGEVCRHRDSVQALIQAGLLPVKELGS